jgi:hypothetical protein
MTKTTWKKAVAVAIVGAGVLLGAPEARADDAVVDVGQGQRFSEPPRDRQDGTAPIVVEDGRYAEPLREQRRAPVRLALGPMGVTTGKGFGLGVGLAADFGTGSVGARLGAAWLRGEGKNGDGTSTATGDSIGQYTGELTLDVIKRGPIHPIIGMGAGLVHISRPDTSGFAGVGTGRLALEYALALEDADVRVGGGITGGLIGPVDQDVKDLRAYALFGLHLAIGF